MKEKEAIRKLTKEELKDLAKHAQDAFFVAFSAGCIKTALEEYGKAQAFDWLLYREYGVDLGDDVVYSNSDKCADEIITDMKLVDLCNV